jgi:short-subunit dehydrogenase
VARRSAKKPVVIITGVSGGIGLETAKKFSSEGWIVVGTVRQKRNLPELAAAGVDLKVAEMTKPADLSRVVQQTLETYGRIDAVIANAGYGLVGRLEDLSYDQISRQLNVNTVAAAEMIRLALPQMRKQQKGAVVAVSSVAGRIGFGGYSAYCASKFALSGLMEAIWYEIKPYGIKVRIIEPSPVNTPFWNSLIGERPKLSSKGLIRKTYRNMTVTKQGLSADKVASHIFKAANSRSDRIHWPVGVTGPLVIIKRLLPDSVFMRLIHKFW